MRVARYCVVSISLAVSAFIPRLCSGETPEEQVKKLATLGSGVYRVKTDDAGRLKSCVVVGQSRISTVLGTAKGRLVAQDRAKLDARAALAKWMQENVQAVQQDSSESIVYLEGTGGQPTESGKATDITKTNVESYASALIRGMTVIGVDQDADTMILTVAMGWSSRDAAHAAEAQGISRYPDSPQPAMPPTDSDEDITSHTVVDDPEGLLR